MKGLYCVLGENGGGGGQELDKTTPTKIGTPSREGEKNCVSLKDRW